MNPEEGSQRGPGPDGEPAGPAVAPGPGAVPGGDEDPAPRVRIPALVAFTLLAALAHCLGFSHELGLSLSLGSALVLAVGELAGPLAGLGSGTVANLATIPLWGHAGGVHRGAMEGFLVPWMRRRFGISLLSAASLYWGLLHPLDLLLTHGVIAGVDPETLIVLWSKNMVCGIATAVIAGILARNPRVRELVTGTPAGPPVALRERLAQAVSLAALVPALTMVLLEVRTQLVRLDQDLDAAMELAAARVSRTMEPGVLVMLDGDGPAGSIRARLEAPGSRPASDLVRLEVGPLVCWSRPWRAPRLARLRRAVYRCELPYLPDPSFLLVLETDLAPAHGGICRRLSGSLAMVLALVGLGLLMARRLASWIADDLDRLAEATRALPERLAAGTRPVWPDPAVLEVDRLSGNFRQAADALEGQLSRLQGAARALESEVEARTAELRSANRELAREIEEHLATEARLRLYQEIFRNSPDAIAVVDTEGRYREQNPAHLALLGYPDAELAGRTPALHLGEAAFAGIAGELAAAGRAEGVYDSITRDGVARKISLSAFTVRDPEGVAVAHVGIKRDVTGTLLQEARLEASRRFLRSVLDAAPNLVFAKDRSGVFRLANRAVAELYGTTLEGLLGRSDADFNPKAGEIEGFLDADRRVIDTGIPLVIAEEAVTDAMGRVHWLQTTKHPIRSEDGSEVLALGIATDITERKAQQRELEIARDGAEAASRAKSDFCTNMSHEIRTPLNGILGLTDLLLESRLDADQKAWVQMLQASGANLLRLVNDVLDFSRAEAGRIEFDRTSFEVSGLVGELERELKVRAGRKGLAATASIPSGVPGSLVGDRGRIRQVVLNLIDNAVKFTDQGRIHLGVGTDPDPPGPGRFWIEVEDSGIGIDEGDLARLFQEFCQLDPSTTRRFGGTGLGLAISQRLAEGMGGRILVESRAGAGSRFRLTLPLGLEPLAPETGRRGIPEPAERLGPGVVLVAEDNPVNLRLVTTLLERRGLTVVGVQNGPEAVATFAARNFDLVLMDVQMPGMDGLEVTRRLRGIESQRGSDRTPVVALTAFAMQEDRTRCLDAGMDDYLSKPILAREFYATVARALGKVTGSVEGARERR